MNKYRMACVESGRVACVDWWYWWLLGVGEGGITTLPPSHFHVMQKVADRRADVALWAGGLAVGAFF